ncbi:hypothetical protein CTAM01_03583 [Colletotrichum tamarilloi]|uniref:Uncharacterized protein n=1 Tax=Colletotrichum tamarilloi TaxID=1209934 RepID=A0ABQ9RL15_9PEZI|nr:uncharacterized protein CTAM01_03583 [Colletotrichum tamarilloi]KAK1506248.1 hypothetical protein CTAM01_03583 [Colletotrichum tamarilloi]
MVRSVYPVRPVPLSFLFWSSICSLTLTCTGGWLAVSVHCSLELDVRTRDRHTPAGLTVVTSNDSLGRKWQGGRAVKKEEGEVGPLHLGRHAARRGAGLLWLKTYIFPRLPLPLLRSCPPPFCLPPFRCLPVNILPPPSPGRPCSSTPSPVLPLSLSIGSGISISPHPSKEIATLLSSFLLFPLFPISSYFSPSSSRSNSCKFSALSFCFFPLSCDAVANRSHFVTEDRQYYNTRAALRNTPWTDTARDQVPSRLYEPSEVGPCQPPNPTPTRAVARRRSVLGAPSQAHRGTT